MQHHRKLLTPRDQSQPGEEAHRRKAHFHRAIHARWGELVVNPDEKTVCSNYEQNPFRIGFCVNCQRQHDFSASGHVLTTKEYKPIPELNQWLLQHSLNPNIIVNPDAVVGVGRPNMPKSRQKNVDGHRESDIDLTKFLRQKGDIFQLKLQESDMVQYNGY
jgi:hypothetical protein